MHSKYKKILAFNWKMNPSSEREAEYLVEVIFAQANNLVSFPPRRRASPEAEQARYGTSSLRGRLQRESSEEIIVCPPFVYLEKLSKLNFGAVRRIIHFGAQDCFWENEGAYTGEISSKMLKNLGAEYVIVGHSERRQILKETDEMINKKVLTALKAGLKVILCIGENSQTRQKGKKAIENFLKNQLEKDIKGISKIHLKNLIIAYEPIWAIGTGNNCNPQDAAKITKFIKSILYSQFRIQNSSVLYGGSVNSKNIKNFLQYKEINGFLVGDAGLKDKEIKNIINSI